MHRNCASHHWNLVFDLPRGLALAGAGDLALPLDTEPLAMDLPRNEISWIKEKRSVLKIKIAEGNFVIQSWKQRMFPKQITSMHIKDDP